MNYLTEKNMPVLHFMHRNYRLLCTFDNVLEVQRLYKVDELTDLEKVEQALKMLTRNPWKLRMLSKKRKIELMNLIYDREIKIPQKPGKPTQQRVVDFDLDSEYIYSSFKADYGIDLMEEQGRMHWKAFVALFQGLTDKTKIKEIMKIRQMEIPTTTKYNRKEVQNIIELKSYYALPVEGGGGQKGLDALWGALEQVATNG